MRLLAIGYWVKKINSNKYTTFWWKLIFRPKCVHGRIWNCFKNNSTKFLCSLVVFMFWNILGNMTTTEIERAFSDYVLVFLFLSVPKLCFSNMFFNNIRLFTNIQHPSSTRFRTFQSNIITTYDAYHWYVGRCRCVCVCWLLVVMLLYLW